MHSFKGTFTIYALFICVHLQETGKMKYPRFWKTTATAVLLLLISVTRISAQQLLPKKQTNTAAGLPIGVFDSGTGGLTVLQAMLTLDAFNNLTGEPGADGIPDFQGEHFEYLADQANMPYGNYAAEHKTELLKEHILKNMDFLLGSQYQILKSFSWIKVQKPQVKMLVIACNTATAYALSDIKAHVNSRHLTAPTIGVIDAGAKAALKVQQKIGKGTIGVFATAGTVASEGYPKALKLFAKQEGAGELSIVSQGGVGLAESIDRDWSYYGDTFTVVRNGYKGPSIRNPDLPIDTSLMAAYHFNRTSNQVLCEYDDKTGSCLDMQINDPSNYVRFHLVTLLEKMRREKTAFPLNILILGCTHYPYLKDTIQQVLQELYHFKQNGEYRYRPYLAENVALIDPAVETAKDAYIALRKASLNNLLRSDLHNQFFISVPNNSLKGVELQPDGWFTYKYKYGRTANAGLEYVKFVPFDLQNVSSATYQRFKKVLPDVYAELKKFNQQLP